MKKLLSLLFLVSICFSIPHGYKSLTHGFRINKLDLGVEPREEWEMPQLSDRREIEEILNQPFYYMNRGTQSYVFASQDGNYVIKFFRRNTPLFLSSKSHYLRIEKTFSASALAFRLAKEETGLIYLHLNPTLSQEPTLQIFDRLGVSHRLPLDRYSFAVQKRVNLLKRVLISALDQNTAEPILDSYLELIAKRAQKGVCNTDVALGKNFGIRGLQVVEIDFGNYVYAPGNSTVEFERFAKKMRIFLSKQSPEILQVYDQKVVAYL